MKRDCVFLLADKDMKASFEGFFSRPGFHHSLKCGWIDVDPTQDMIVASGDKDPGLYTRAHEILRPFLRTHRFAVVVLDAWWTGAPKAAKIRTDMESMLSTNGWDNNRSTVIVIDPELEVWILQQNVHVAREIGFDGIDDMLSDIDLRQAWSEEHYMPMSPKETLMKILRKKNLPITSARYKKITAQVSVSDCCDSAFLQLVEKLREWFPPDSDEVNS